MPVFGRWKAAIRCGVYGLATTIIWACSLLRQIEQPTRSAQDRTPPEASHFPTFGPSAPLEITPDSTPRTASELARGARVAFDALAGYQATLRYFQRSGDQVERGLHEIAGKPPRTLRIIPREGRGEGSRILWAGGVTVKVRPAGLLSKIILEIPLESPELVSIRGYTFAESDFRALLDVLAAPENAVQLSSQDASTFKLEILGEKLLKGTHRMGLSLDARTLLPKTVEAFDESGRVLENILTSFEASPDVSVDI